jgi:hypothetical protein
LPITFTIHRRRERAVEKRVNRGASATRRRACCLVTVTIHKTMKGRKVGR